MVKEQCSLIGVEKLKNNIFKIPRIQRQISELLKKQLTEKII